MSDNCPEVSGITAKAGFRRIDLSWHHHPDQNAFVVQWRPRTQSGSYEWQSETVFENSYTIDRLQAGWTYEYRVGALCIRNEPVFGSGGEVTLPEQNEERLKNCGKIPVVDLVNQEPNEQLQVGDMVRIGGDFPMRVDELTPLGNGWYSGKGGLVLPWIFEIGVNVEFARLRVNTDNVQIDGEVETSYDKEESLIGNTNQLDNGGSTLQQGGITLPKIEVDFTVPDRPSCTYNEDTGELVITDEDGGNPHTVTVPKNQGKSSFPIEVVDKQGNRYQIEEDGLIKQFGHLDSAEIDKLSQLLSDIPSNDEPARILTVEEIMSIKDSLGIIRYKFDKNSQIHIKIASVVNKYLIEYAKNFSDLPIAPNIEVVNDTSSYGAYNEDSQTILLTNKLSGEEESQYKYTVFHELAHFEHSQRYNNTYRILDHPILAEYYDFINNIHTYPQEQKNLALRKTNAQEAETVYNRETYATIYGLLRSFDNVPDNNILKRELVKKITPLLKKHKSGTITNEENTELMRLREIYINFEETLEKVLNILKQQ